jgi:hypothetical protein
MEGLNEAGQAIQAAVESRDFTAMRAQMGDMFAFAVQDTSLIVVESDQAIETLKVQLLADGSQPVFVWSTDVPALLNGVDPLSIWGPVDVVVRAVHVSGLGPQADEEAVVVIGRAPDGRFVWHGILSPKDGRYFQAQ